VIHRMLVSRVGSPRYVLPMLWSAAAIMVLFVAHTGWLAGLAVVAVLLVPGTWREIGRLPLGLRGMRYAK